MSIIPDVVIDRLDLSDDQIQFFREREKNSIFRWYIKDRFFYYLQNYEINILKEMLPKLGLFSPEQITDFEIDDRVAVLLGAKCYPTDSVQQGSYWYFPDQIEAFPELTLRGEIYRGEFRPTNDQNGFHRMLFRKMQCIEKLDDAGHEYRARASKDSDWCYGSLGRAVCLAFLSLGSVSPQGTKNDVEHNNTDKPLFWCLYCQRSKPPEEFPNDSPVHLDVEIHEENPYRVPFAACTMCLKDEITGLRGLPLPTP